VVRRGRSEYQRARPDNGREASSELGELAALPKPTTVKGANKMFRDFFLGFVRVHVLHHASVGPLYGVWFLSELSRHNYELSPGTLYPLLHGLEADGYLKRHDRVVEGKVRKYYRITPLGQRVQMEARMKIAELIDEISEDAHPVKGQSAHIAAKRLTE
jgi:DNA-binding PadR family transcriptional regulator